MSWSDLEKDVATVVTTVDQEGTLLGSARASKNADATTTQALEIAVLGPGDLEIESRALKADDAAVGEPVSQTLSAPPA